MPIGAAIGAAVIGAGATMISSSNASHAQTQAANQAASIEQQNAAANNQLARDMHADAVSRLDPYSQMGLAAGDEYMGLLLGDKGSQHSSGWATAPAPSPTPTPTPGTTGSTPTGGYTVGTPSTTIPGTHHMTADEMSYFNSLPPEQQSGYINYLTGTPAPTNALAPVAAPAPAPASALHPVVAQQAQAAIAAGANPVAVAQRAAQYGVQL